MANDRLVDEFMELVKIGAASGDERGVADALKAKLESLGCVVEEDNAGETFGGNCGNLFTVIDGGLDGSILFTSHMDRVAGGYGVNPSVKDGRVVTDGTTILAADDLSGALSIIEGARRLLKSEKKFPRVEILFCVGEEKRLLGSAAFDPGRLQSRLGYALDSPGPVGRIIRAAPSRAALECEVFGKTAHAGNEPEKGCNAVIALGKILAGIRDGRLDSESTANFAILETRSPSVNIVPDYAKVTGETRSLSNDKLDAYIKYFEEYCAKAVEGTGCTAKTTATVDFRSFDIPEDSTTVSLARKVFGDMGVEMFAERAGGGMDANNLNQYGVECVGLATGYFRNHTVNEYLEIEDFLKGGEMVERLIMAYAETLGK